MAPGYVCTLQNNNCNNKKKSSTRSYQWWLYFDLCECVYVCVKDAKLYYVWENANVLKGCTYLQWWFMTLSIFSILLVQCYRFESSISGLKALAFRVRVNSFSLYVNFFICYFPHRMLTVKVMRYVWLQNVQNEGRGQSELQRQNEISHFRSATKWHMVMFKWLSPEMVVVIMTGAKEEIRCHCCTAAKPEHGDGGLRWMGDSAKNTILTRYTTAHFLFHTVSKMDLKASYCYRPNKFSD